jgi:hypothetical protein
LTETKGDDCTQHYQFTNKRSPTWPKCQKVCGAVYYSSVFDEDCVWLQIFCGHVIMVRCCHCLSICRQNGFCVITLVLVDRACWIFNTKIPGTKLRLVLILGIVELSFPDKSLIPGQPVFALFYFNVTVTTKSRKSVWIDQLLC